MLGWLVNNKLEEMWEGVVAYFEGDTILEFVWRDWATKSLTQDSRPLGRDSNPGFHVHETAVLTSWPWVPLFCIALQICTVRTLRFWERYKFILGCSGLQQKKQTRTGVLILWNTKEGEKPGGGRDGIRSRRQDTSFSCMEFIQSLGSAN
jgi:hypothetical protein